MLASAPASSLAPAACSRDVGAQHVGAEAEPARAARAGPAPGSAASAMRRCSRPIRSCPSIRASASAPFDDRPRLLREPLEHQPFLPISRRVAVLLVDGLLAHAEHLAICCQLQPCSRALPTWSASSDSRRCAARRRRRGRRPGRGSPWRRRGLLPGSCRQYRLTMRGCQPRLTEVGRSLSTSPRIAGSTRHAPSARPIPPPSMPVLTFAGPAAPPARREPKEGLSLFTRGARIGSPRHAPHRLHPARALPPRRRSTRSSRCCPRGVHERALAGGRTEVSFYEHAADLPPRAALAAAAGTADARRDGGPGRPDRAPPAATAARGRWRGGCASARPDDPPGDGTLPELVIEAAAGAFGTGAHPTTRMCLELLLDIEPGGPFADLGCGAGVLAIAAAHARLGAGLRGRPRAAERRRHARATPSATARGSRRSSSTSPPSRRRRRRPSPRTSRRRSTPRSPRRSRPP